ncbi:MAG: RagB/SusD family nutrient uptake outer membrane protein, partial [Mediterranea sp.]|nr:RagB/SusD family nutrient uptake outer membrane protein [Mediterranea sp.]
MKKILVILVTGLLLCSCEDFLDTKNYTKKDTSNFPQTAEDAEQMIAGIYNALNSAFADADNQAYSKSQLFLSEIASDERYGSAGQNDPLWQALDKLMNYGYDMMMAAWKIPYQGIFRCNTAIKALPNCVGFRPGQLEEYTGEAYFLRGYFFFNLAQVFENVPLPVDPDPANLPQSPVEDTYGQIASDLQQAIELLPSAKSSFPSKGHATKWAAEALMARVFLFYTGYYGKSELPVAGGGSISKSQVISWLEDCINNSGHDLLSDFRSLWPYANPYAKEKYKYITDAEVAERKTIPAWPGDGHRET